MPKRPCIRGLVEFKKNGCPQMKYNYETGQGCPAWVELVMANKDGTEKEEIKNCVDVVKAIMQWHTNALLEGNQQAIESFRNGMTYMNQEGKVLPRPDPVLQVLHKEMLLRNEAITLIELDGKNEGDENQCRESEACPKSVI